MHLSKSCVLMIVDAILLTFGSLSHSKKGIAFASIENIKGGKVWLFAYLHLQLRPYSEILKVVLLKDTQTETNKEMRFCFVHKRWKRTFNSMKDLNRPKMTAKESVMTKNTDECNTFEILNTWKDISCMGLHCKANTKRIFRYFQQSVDLPWLTIPNKGNKTLINHLIHLQ